MISECSIVLPTHEKPEYLKRAIAYYSEFKCKVYICDSSKKRFEGKLAENINYIQCPEKGFIQKLSDTLELINTKYLIICTDDDFLSNTSLERSINFLNNNQDHIAAQGFFWGYQPGSNLNEPTKFFPINEESKKLVIEEKEAYDRLSHLMQNYMHLSYGLHRTKILKNIFLYCYQNGIKNYNLIELLVAIIPISYGKYKTLDVLHSVREVSHVSSGSTCETIGEIRNSKSLIKEYESFIEFIFNVFNKSISKDKIEDVLTIYINKSVKPRCPEYIPVDEKYKSKSKFQILIVIYSNLIIRLSKKFGIFLKNAFTNGCLIFGDSIFFLSASNQLEFRKIKTMILQNPIKKI